MRLRNLFLPAALFFAVTMSSITLAANPAPPAPPQGGMGQGKMEKNEGRERHPEIRKAIEQLRRAKADLQRANHDFGGHREAALQACDNAIQQLQQALNYDKK